MTRLQLVLNTARLCLSRLLARRHLFQANALGGLGLAYINEERYDKAIDWFTAALNTSAKAESPASSA